MAKIFFVLLLIAAAGFLLYRNTGGPASEEEGAVKALEARYQTAVGKFLRAGSAAAGIGLDTISDAESAAVEIQKTRAELERLRKTLTEEKALRKAEELAGKIDNFCQKNDIISP